MFKWSYPILLALMYSCASVSADWTPWQLEDVASAEREWSFCKEELNGPGFHPNDVCYESEECRTKKVLIGSDKRECRGVTLTCGHGDSACFIKYGINTMTISNKK